MLAKFFKFLLLIAIMIAIPFIWWTSVKSFGSIKAISISTGVSLFSLGLVYKLMGTWDLIPDWIPLIRGMDDSIAWGGMVVGILLGGAGFYFL